MLQEPGQSQYDLNFNLLGFPVRIAWGFWLVAAILGWDMSSALAGAEDSPGALVLLMIWIVVMLVSILIHELGHSLAMQYYGMHSRIVLYHFGGLAIPDAFTSWRGARQRRAMPMDQIVISAAGPAIQLVFGIAAWALAIALDVRLTQTRWLDNWLGTSLFENGQVSSVVVYVLFSSLVWINIAWALFNLAPILPLDGGQIMRNSLLLSRAGRPEHLACMISIGTGVLIGLWFLSINQFGPGIMFLLFAASNWQTLQGGYRGF